MATAPAVRNASVGVPIQSLAVVGGSHKRWNEVRQHLQVPKKNNNPDFCKLQYSSDSAKRLAKEAVLVNHRPLLGNATATTVVLWRSDVVHCNAVEDRATAKQK